MLCKDKITSIFCIINDILKEINHSEDIPPLAQACSLSPIQNSQFSPRPICPTCLTRPTCLNPPSHLNPPSFLILKKICTLSKVKHKQYTNDTGRAKDKRTISED